MSCPRNRGSSSRAQHGASAIPQPAHGPARRHRREGSDDPFSNVAHIDPKSNKPTRVGYKVLEDGRKVRVATAVRRSPRCVSDSSMMTATCRNTTDNRPPVADEGVRLRERDASAAARQDRHQYGRRRGGAGRQEDRRRGEGADADHRAEAGGDQRQEVDRRPSSCARTCRSAARSRCAANACTNSSTAW